MNPLDYWLKPLEEPLTAICMILFISLALWSGPQAFPLHWHGHRFQQPLFVLEAALTFPLWYMMYTISLGICFGVAHLILSLYGTGLPFDGWPVSYYGSFILMTVVSAALALGYILDPHTSYEQALEVETIEEFRWKNMCASRVFAALALVPFALMIHLIINPSIGGADHWYGIYLAAGFTILALGMAFFRYADSHRTKVPTSNWPERA